MKKLAVAGLTTAVLALTAVGNASAATYNCGDESATVGSITTSNVGCRKAHRVVRATSRGKKYGRFKCKSKRYEGGATVTCKSGNRVVRYQVAD
jgi:hypothetical protein